MKHLSVFCLVASLLVFACRVMAHEGATGIIKDRMDGFKLSQQNFKSAINAAKQGDFATVKARADGLAEWAAAMVGNFPEGSGGSPSQAAMTIWTDRSGFTDAAAAFGHASQGLAAAASSADGPAVMAAINSVAQSCKSCHRSYRLE